MLSSKAQLPAQMRQKLRAWREIDDAFTVLLI
jgi:hypothetical protein